MKTVQQLVDKYYTSNDYSMLRDRTKQDYKYFLSVMCKEFGDVKYKDLTSKQAKHAYEDWVARGISLANHVCTVLNVSLHHNAKWCGLRMTCVNSLTLHTVRLNGVALA